MTDRFAPKTGRTGGARWTAVHLIAAMGLVGLPPIAVAGDAGITDGRYQMQRSGPNVLRLDRHTGAIASCAESDEGSWRCETLIAGDATTSRHEGALAAENKRLRERVAALEARLADIARIVRDARVAGATTTQTSASFDAERARREIDAIADVTGYSFKRFIDVLELLREKR